MICNNGITLVYVSANDQCEACMQGLLIAFL